MFGVNVDYLKTAREHEPIFRKILRDLIDNREERPMGCYVPEGLQIEIPLEEIFQRYSQGNRLGRFTITDFAIKNDETGTFAVISFEDIAVLSGGGASLQYAVTGNEVAYQRTNCTIMS